MADFKATETRLESLERSIQKLLILKDKAEEDMAGEKIEDKEGADHGKDQSPEEKVNQDQEEEKNVTLIPKLNCLSWPEWRKLRLSEHEFDERQKDATKKESQKPNSKPRQYVIDVVSDMGDLGPPAYTDSQLSIKGSRLFGRIRINSQHVLDVLSEITNLFLPQRCQMLHPYKVIIDNLVKIKDYMKILEDELERAKTDIQSTSQTKQSKQPEEVKSKHEPVSMNQHVDAHTEGKTPKSREERDLEVAQEKVDHYRCFMELLETKLALEVDVAKTLKTGTAERIMFCHLWHLFPPGETIYYQKSNRDEPPQAAQILKVSGGRPKLPSSARWYNYWDQEERKKTYQKVSPFTIDAFHLDFDGKKFRPFQVKYEIPKYPGELPITSLPVFPLRFLEESRRAVIMSLLLKRGLNFRNLAAVESAHREFRGRTLDPEPEDIDGRVIIDFKQASVVDNLRQKTSQRKDNDEEEGRVFGLRPLSQTNNTEVAEVIGRDEDPDLTLYDDHTYDIDRTEKLFSVNKVLLAPLQELNAEDLTDDELRLLPGTVYAYILRSRKYCRCDISFIKEIDLNRRAFDDLVLPTKYKNLLKSLVDRHSLGSRPVEQKTDTDRPLVERTDSQLTQSNHGVCDTLSIVKGKGRGLIILLHGVPGVGKTSTAETIAEATGRPLLPVTCGDIGENATDVEKNLEQIFTNSHRWGCVLLLDEAEVFLIKRNLQDLTRNAMVSVFLRALEFYSGILFLTTNRVGTIDEAFKSRIHISLYYPPHDWKTSKQIWQINLGRSMEKVEADKDEILRYAKKQFHRADENSRWNGRQIYNAFKTAIALAEYEWSTRDGKTSQKAVLTESHFRQVAQVAKKFDEYLLETHGGMSIAATNQQQNIRADGFGVSDDGPQKLKRRPTKARKIDFDEIPSTSEGDSDGGSDVSNTTEDEYSSEEVKKPKRKGKVSNKKNDEKKKSQNSKSKNSSRRQVEDESEESS
ncbi:P-loop containing nucleoside triphosphate hydrolase protein [Xylariaceae sp. AK1471]|nr:P-loop containing nucleoside triphosphate hydrolase protein [Xylariaceae sp. AK1471]